MTEEEKIKIIHSFISFVIDETTSLEFSDYISAYIVKQKRDLTFTKQLNTIKEGVVLYTGLKYNSTNELGSWTTELTIFLETEMLFHFAGYNGELYKILFDDLFSLISEINLTSIKKKGKRLIHLKYFSDVKNDIENFFKKAEHIVLGRDKANPSKTAMTTIIDGCKTPADVVAKKTRFYNLLKQNSIIEDDYTEYYSIKNHQYNIEDQDLLDELSQKMNIDDLQPYLKYLNFVNIHRRGNSDNAFERIGYVLLSGTAYTLRLALDENIKPNGNIPLASNLSFLTNKFWFKLNKGFGKSDPPKSFDIVAKAQIVLSTQLNDTVSDKFDELQAKLKSGQITKEEVISTLVNLRSEAKKPEEINENNILNILGSIEENTIENHLKEQELFKLKADKNEKENSKLKETLALKRAKEEELQKRNEKLEAELNKYKEAERKKELTKFQNNKWESFCKSKVKDLYYFFFIAFITLLPILGGIIIKTIKSIDEFVQNSGNCKWIILGVTILLLLVDIMGRSYLFNKERIKSGWQWLTISKEQKLKLRDKEFSDYENEFNMENN
ncbi:hypothetical protein [Capnocytophaga sp.]|uniref:hypothetical protein n=1 Tax=Capnocytophaga sp. TaxID=44737 RepID=UPI0026DB4F42|nr:hypothetical protein [Capnocytophaga sp.]MDO5106260.1 hypothetical protein [Capnocytophaga sp.]